MSAKLKPWLVLAVIFIAGVLSGAALTIGLSSYFMRPPGEAQVKMHLIARYSKELDLTPDQQRKIEPILADAAAQLQAVHHDEIGRVSDILRKADSNVAPFLTGDQKILLGKIVREREKMFSGHMHLWDHPHGDNNATPPPAPPPASVPGDATKAPPPPS